LIYAGLILEVWVEALADVDLWAKYGYLKTKPARYGQGCVVSSCEPAILVYLKGEETMVF